MKEKKERQLKAVGSFRCRFRGSLFSAIAVLIMFIDLQAQIPHFDSDSAFQFLELQCAFGPRNPGSSGYLQCKEWLVEQLKSRNGEVYLQKFTAFDPISNKNRNLTNIIARFGSPDGQPVMLCAHYDTRPIADLDKNPANTKIPILGANDGASGVAVLLEIARLMTLSPPDQSVLIVFFDGEDFGRSSHAEEFAQGSRYWALHPVPEMPREAVLLDMIGDADLQIPLEWFSRQYAPTLQKRIWDIAEELGSEAFVNRLGPAVEDDHVPLIRAGIPAIDLIDFDYQFWHTLEDTPDKCSAGSLEQVGKVLMAYIYR